jgi:hypothetical protein
MIKISEPFVAFGIFVVRISFINAVNRLSYDSWQIHDIKNRSSDGRNA